MRGVKSASSTDTESNSTTTNSHSRCSGETVKRCFLVLLIIIAILSSVWSILSCKFFSYREIDVFNDSYPTRQSIEPVISYEPFEYLPKAGVGLFAYYMGDPSAKIVITVTDPMCFTYCDEETDYQWLSSNTQSSSIVDIWVLARYCSILAPAFGLMALIMIVVEFFRKFQRGYTLIETQLFLIAALFQIGTFSVVSAPPIMYSTSEFYQEQQFCFSDSSNVTCKMDTGSWFSLASVVLYLSLAVLSFCSRRSSKVGGDVQSMTETEHTPVGSCIEITRKSNHSRMEFAGRRLEESEIDDNISESVFDHVNDLSPSTRITRIVKYREIDNILDSCCSSDFEKSVDNNTHLY